MIGVVIALFLGLGLLVLGAWVGVKLALVPSVIVLEHAGIRTAMARSWRLTDNAYWRTFGVLLLVGVILNIAAQVVVQPVSLVGTILAAVIDPTGTGAALTITIITTVVTLVLSLLIGAITAVVQAALVAVIYIDLRMRKEGLDLELERYVELRDAGQPVGDPYAVPEPVAATAWAPAGRSARKRAAADVVLTPLLETPPLDPDAPEAQRWLQDELSKPEYVSAEPNAFDRAMQSIRDWFLGLFEGASGIPGPLLALLVILVVVAIVVIGLLVFGLPRLRRGRRPADAAVRRPRPTRPRGAAPGGERRRRGGRLAARDRGAVPGDRARRRRPRPRARAPGHDGARRRGCRIRAVPRARRRTARPPPPTSTRCATSGGRARASATRSSRGSKPSWRRRRRAREPAAEVPA